MIKDNENGENNMDMNFYDKHSYISEEDKEKICYDYMSGLYTQIKLAEKYNVSLTNVNRILKANNITRKDKQVKENNIMPRKNKRKKINREQYSIPQIKKITETVTIEEPSTENNKDNKEEEDLYCILKFVTDIPVYEISKDKYPISKIIWCVSKNRSVYDLREDINIKTVDELYIINNYRNRYYFVSIRDNILHLIDFFDVTNKTAVLYKYKPDTKILFNNEDGVISNKQIFEGINEIIKYDKSIERTRLRLNDFEFDKFTDLHKIFGLDKFSFNIASKNNSETVEAGLIADRHVMPVDKFIFPESFDQDLMFDYPEQERIAKDFIKSNFDFSNDKIKQLKLYVTGMQCAYGAVMKMCIEMGINLITMHYNASNSTYVPQYINGNIEDTGSYVKAFDKIISQKSLKSEILLFNCTYEDFLESNVKEFYVMEAAKMKNTNSSDNQKEESIVIIIKDRNDIWKLYPTLLNHMIDNDGLNLALWVVSAEIRNNSFIWGMNIVKSFNYK